MNGPLADRRNTEEPQPECCALCGLAVGGAHLQACDVEGLRGQRVCDVTEGCRRFRNSPSYADIQQISPAPGATIGDSRVYEPGAAAWWE